MAVLSREFPLNPGVLGRDSAATLVLGAATGAETLASIAVNKPFPPGAIDLAHISLQAGTGSGISFQAGSTAVRVRGAAGTQSGLGVFDSAADALESLAPGSRAAAPAAAPGARWAVLRSGYEVSGNISGSHPIGVIGSATLGIDAEHDACLAVLHRFDANMGARDVVAETVQSWKLPRHVDFDHGDVNLKPGTWLIAEADGSLALNLAVKLGYDVSFMHEAAVLGITRDLGARIDAGLKTTFGVSVSGRYLVMVGRDGAAPTVRVRLHKESRQGMTFGLNLDVGVKGTPPLPATFDAFVQAVFGVHGPQVLKELQALEEWIDPEKDLGTTAARLATRTGMDLLRETTGLDPAALFSEARARVAGALQSWNRLPDAVTAMLWRFLSSEPDPARVESFKALLRSLSDPDPQVRRAALADVLETAAVGDSDASNWLQAVASRGLTTLAQNLDGLGAVAGATLALLENDIVQRLQRFISTRLDLEAVRRAVSDEDFNALDEWLVRRLADLINTSVPHLDDLKQVQKAVLAVDAKARGVYESGVKALSKRYSAEIAAEYQKSDSGTALLDASFDLNVPDALSHFRSLVQGGELDDLLTASIRGVHLHDATLTHGIRKTEHVELRLPFIAGARDRVMESLATLSVEEHAGRVLAYEFAATDKLKIANRMRSELSVLGSIRTRPGGAPLLAGNGTIAYEARQVAKRIGLAELEQRTRPFVEVYLAPLFGGGGDALRPFYNEVAAAVAAAKGQPASPGDVALLMQVSYPVQVLEGWLTRRKDEDLHEDAMRLSRAVQASVRRLLVRTYFDDLDHLQFQPPTAALLVWASMPVSTSIDAKRTPIRFNTDRAVFWDYAAVQDRRAVASDRHTTAALSVALERAQARLDSAGRDSGHFQPSRTAQFLAFAVGDTGDKYLSALLRAEALMIEGADRAFRTIAKANESLEKKPGVAVAALSEFGAALVDTFGGRLEFLYSPELARTLGPTILADASAAIHPTLRLQPPGAMLRMYVFRERHEFPLNKFLEGELPPSSAVAVAETLVRP